MKGSADGSSRRAEVSPAKLDFAWAERRWKDPLTGAEVVCLSPQARRHYRVNYFRKNMMSWDGRWIVFLEATDCREGVMAGRLGMTARNLQTGELRELGTIPTLPPAPRAGISFQGYDSGIFAVSRYSHLVNAIDWTDPRDQKLIQFDIDTGARRTIGPDRKLCNLYEPSFDATERYTYTPWWKEGWPLRESMDPAEHRAMMASRPGAQDMLRIDLESGRTEAIFSTDRWWMGHPNPHPTLPDLFMCCQEWYGEDKSTRWGECPEHERIRLFDVATRSFIHKPGSLGGAHEHWAPGTRGSRRIYAHGGVGGTHAIYVNDVTDPSEPIVRRYDCPPGTGFSVHVLVSPDETFLVGDGVNAATLETPAEVVWKYELESDGHAGVRPIASFRAMTRTLLAGGHRLETNAHVTPDSRWTVFQSSSDDDWFEVWAARVP